MYVVDKSMLLLLLLFFSTVGAAMCLCWSWNHCTLHVPESWPVSTTVLCNDMRGIPHTIDRRVSYRNFGLGGRGGILCNEVTQNLPYVTFSGRPA